MNQAVRNEIEDVKIISTEAVSDSKYIKPMRLTYDQNGVKKVWDYMQVHDSVAIVICNVTTQSIVLVRQFRPAVYMRDCAHAKKIGKSETVPPSVGVTYELCAGIIDRDAPACEIAASEVLEETGYKVSSEKLELIMTYRSGVGVTGNMQHLYYVEVTNEIKVHDGGGCEHEGEMIDLYNLKLSEVKAFVNDQSIVNRPCGLVFALSWFLENKISKFI